MDGIITEFTPDEVKHRCAFCYKDHTEVAHLYKGGASIICSECVEAAYKLIKNKEKGA